MKRSSARFENNLEILHSAKIMLSLKMRYKSANPVEQYVKQVCQELSVHTRVIGEVPVIEANIPIHINPISMRSAYLSIVFSNFTGVLF